MIDMISAVGFEINTFFIRTQQTDLEARCQHIMGTLTEPHYVMGTSVIEENPIEKRFFGWYRILPGFTCRINTGTLGCCMCCGPS
jgi:hypothetical protein